MCSTKCLMLALVIAALGIGPTARAADTLVTITDAGGVYTLANGIVTAQVDKASGRLRSLVYRGVETVGVGYWSHAPSGPDVTDAITISPQITGGLRGEVSVKEVSRGQPMGSGPGGSTVADIEVRYALDRGSSGLYTYSVFDHKPSYPATSIGEARYAVKLNDDVFDWMTVDADRNIKMITASDWDHGTRMNMKEARRMTTGIMKGQVEHKYDYSAVQFDTPAYGWSSTSKHIGFWIVNPSDEYLSGGPTKLELSAHRDATFTDSLTAPAAPTLLNYWRGSHYGGSSCVMGQGEEWTKVIGPFLLYCNSGPTPEAVWKDAMAQAGREAEAWPYAWVSGVNYPHKEGRGTVGGRIVLADPLAPAAKMPHLLVGLAYPDYTPTTGGPVDWQTDAKHYEFWVRGDAQGHFTIPNVRPGPYTLHAIADGVLGEYAKVDVTIAAGQILDLGRLTWTPVRHGRQLWDIGVPDRTAKEFLHGGKGRQWGLYLQYPKDFPNDVHYVIGKSDYHKDWNYAQVPRASDETGSGNGPATTWSVTFGLPAALHGSATLCLALAGSSARHVAVAVNGKPAGETGPLPDTATIRRDALRGYWQERDVTFDAALMKAGTNVLTLTVPAGGVMSGVEYDYLRLELDDAATARKGAQ